MRNLSLIAVLLSLGACGTPPAPTLPPLVVANDNRTAAGTLRDGVMTVELDVVMACGKGTHDSGAADPGAGRDPGAPRGPQHLADTTVGLWGKGVPASTDTNPVAVLPGASETVEFTATAAGTYMYGARNAAWGPDWRETEQLAGAIVVDEPGARPAERILVMNIWSLVRPDGTDRNVYTINGRSWPHTEPFEVAAGDTLAWRVVNPTNQPHPMRLHGAYFRVDARGDGWSDTVYVPPGGGPAAHSTDPARHMSGLVIGVAVRSRGPAPARPNVRRLSVLIARGVAKDTGHAAPISFSLTPKGPQPATAIHWHGLELESWSDGVAGLSGVGSNGAPPIAPGDSFVARLTLKRAGTFIYHTHLNDQGQLPAGLFGPIVVLEPGQRWDPAWDLIFTAGLDRTSLDGPAVDGSRGEDEFAMRLGQRVRMRFINTQPEAFAVFELTGDSLPAVWRPMAKDGYELPEAEAVTGPSRRTLGVGETFDAEFEPTAPGRYRLRMKSGLTSGAGEVVYERVVRVLE